nr:unnamed protein product [Callosobruchus analis]
MTIPRLELLAATIGARLYTSVAENLSQRYRCFFWSDSSTVISWIQRKEEWGVFVWNRVAEIRSITSISDWRHLPGTKNPADLPSRGCSPRQLLDSKWWEGPLWLYEAEGNWPSEEIAYDEEEVYAERKKKLVTTLVSIGCTSFWNIDYFSKSTKTVRIITYIFRFVHNCRHPNDRRSGELSVEEQVSAENFVFKVIQQECFAGVDDPRIASLCPFCDKEDLIRMKSRVSNREDTENYRFPIILPAKHAFVHRLIMDTHVKSCHAGTQGLLGLLREKYWILGGRRSVRTVVARCVICKRHDSKPLEVETPPLPTDRVRDAMAFEVVGVDYAGPLFLKIGGKVWICLFTCAIFRAVHLELCTSLSTSCFLQAFRRFVARRGRPKTVYTDNGSNFVGAENAFASLDWDAITRESSVQRIQWRFNPPAAPWWGGFWDL